MPFVSRTRATLRSAEFGFFGVVVYTRVQTPRFCGAPRSAGVFVFTFGVARPFRTSWFTVGTRWLLVQVDDMGDGWVSESLTTTRFLCTGKHSCADRQAARW